MKWFMVISDVSPVSRDRSEIIGAPFVGIPVRVRSVLKQSMGASWARAALAIRAAEREILCVKDIILL